MTAPVDVLAVMDAAIAAAHSRLKDAQTEGTVAASAFRSSQLDGILQARAAIAELIEADREFDAAHHDWEHVTAHDPQETSDEDWRRIADRFEAATMRRIAALARVGGAK